MMDDGNLGYLSIMSVIPGVHDVGLPVAPQHETMATVSPECTVKLDLASQCITWPHPNQTAFAKAERENPEN
jgi:hypothetical protein